MRDVWCVKRGRKDEGRRISDFLLNYTLPITYHPLPRPRFALARSRGCRAGVELITLNNVHEIRAVQGFYGYLREESAQRTVGARAWRSGATRNGASRSHCFQAVYDRATRRPLTNGSGYPVGHGIWAEYML